MQRGGCSALNTGTVKLVPNVRTYAFVLVEDGPAEEVFFHRSAVADNGFDQLWQGQRVRFEIAPNPRTFNKRYAVGVAPIE
jgi:cold shock CspA family protein